MKAFKHLIAESECTRFMLDVADGSAGAPGMVLAAGELETEPGELAPSGVVDRSSLATRVSLRMTQMSCGCSSIYATQKH